MSLKAATNREHHQLCYRKSAITERTLAYAIINDLKRFWPAR